MGAVSAFAVIVILALVNADSSSDRNVTFFAGLNCLTLGLFSFVVNAFMFLVGEHNRRINCIWAFTCKNFRLRRLFGSLTLSLITGMSSGMLIPDSDKSSKSKRRRSTC